MNPNVWTSLGRERPDGLWRCVVRPEDEYRLFETELRDLTHRKVGHQEQEHKYENRLAEIDRSLRHYGALTSARIFYKAVFI